MAEGEADPIAFYRWLIKSTVPKVLVVSPWLEPERPAVLTSLTGSLWRYNLQLWRLDVRIRHLHVRVIAGYAVLPRHFRDPQCGRCIRDLGFTDVATKFDPLDRKASWYHDG